MLNSQRKTIYENEMSKAQTSGLHNGRIKLTQLLNYYIENLGNW